MSYKGDARELEFEPCSELFVDTWETFTTRSDGELSFTDAAILTLARERGADRVATFDAGFAGFDDLAILPRSG